MNLYAAFATWLDQQPEHEVTPDHLKLLARLNLGWCTYSHQGAPGVDPAHIFGNSDHLDDICRILGWTKAGDDGHAPCWSSQQRAAARRLHGQMATALECVLRSGSFEPGEFRQDDFYRWGRV